MVSDWEREEVRRPRLVVVVVVVVGVAAGRPFLLPLPLWGATRAVVIGGLKTGIVPCCIMSFRAHSGTV